MRAIVTIQHPAHVHFFRNAITELQDEGHDIHVLARKKDIATDLLKKYDIDYTIIAGSNNGGLDLVKTQSIYEANILRKTYELSPDVLTAIAEPGIAHASTLSQARSVLFTDTEHATLQNKLAFPFADNIYTPECYLDDIGSKQFRYPGYHELAYLHPNRFSPDPEILNEVGVHEGESLVILRLVSWDAAHDMGNSGFERVTDAVRFLESQGATVLITSEADLPREIEDRQASIPIHKMHDLMYYADLFIGEGSTMAAESAVLGTPAIFVSSLELGYTKELENRFDLVFNFSSEEKQTKALNKAKEVLQTNDSTWERCRSKLLEEKNDTTNYIVEALKNTKKIS